MAKIYLIECKNPNKVWGAFGKLMKKYYMLANQIICHPIEISIECDQLPIMTINILPANERKPCYAIFYIADRCPTEECTTLVGNDYIEISSVSDIKLSAKCFSAILRRVVARRIRERSSNSATVDKVFFQEYQR